MSKRRMIQTNFTAGEFSPQLLGRFDIGKYDNAVLLLQNMIPKRWGGASQRPGTKYASAIKDQSSTSRLLGFQFNTEQGYILEFGAQYVRIYAKDSGTGAWGLLQSGGVPVEKTTPYASADLSALSYTQSNDVMYLAHPSHPPQVLSRTSVATTWTLGLFASATTSGGTLYMSTDGPYDPINSNAEILLNPSAATGNGITIAAEDSGASPVTGVFTSTDVPSANIPGRLVRLKHSTQWGYAVIKTVAGDGSSCTADVIKDFGGTTATLDWSLGAWSRTTGWPSVVMLHQQRLWFANRTEAINRVWSSVADDFENFQPSAPSTATTTATDSIVRVIDDNQVNAVLWMASASRGLLVGTFGNEYLGAPSSSNSLPQPDDFDFRRQSNFGSRANVEPQHVGNSVLFVQRSGCRVHELAFRFEQDQYVAPDVTLLAEHALSSPAVDSAYQQNPHSVIFYLRQDGKMAGVTFDRSQDVSGWCRIIAGGSFDGGDAVIESIAVVRDDPDDLVFMIVKRTINNQTKKYVEYMTPYFSSTASLSDAFLVDSGLTYSGTAVNAVSGLGHLEGQTVNIIADGAVHPNKVVIGGSVSLDYYAEKVSVGLRVICQLKTMPIVNVPADDGSPSVGKKVRPTRAHIMLNRSLGGYVSTEEANP